MKRLALARDETKAARSQSHYAIQFRYRAHRHHRRIRRLPPMRHDAPPTPLPPARGFCVIELRAYSRR
ncbi:hypothetical protein [Pseudomonas sp. CGJS7]|uniref:hypothetical protein n=1 Tax=Pseudomonas sp. CGJS7 TaxID=3109348 RepID=UPI003009A35E